MAKKKKPPKRLKIPRGLPGAGQFASKKKIDFLKQARYAKRHPGKYQWFGFPKGLQDSLHIAYDEAGLPLAKRPKIWGKTAWPSKKWNDQWDVIDIFFEQPLDLAEANEAYAILYAHLQGHWPPRNQAIWIIFFKEGESKSLGKGMVKDRMASELKDWKKAYDQIHFRIEGMVLRPDSEIGSDHQADEIVGIGVSIQAGGRR